MVAYKPSHAPRTTQLYYYGEALLPHVVARRHHSLRASLPLHPPERPTPIAASLIGHASQHASTRWRGERRHSVCINVSTLPLVCALLCSSSQNLTVKPLPPNLELPPPPRSTTQARLPEFLVTAIDRCCRPRSKTRVPCACLASLDSFCSSAGLSRSHCCSSPS